MGALRSPSDNSPIGFKSGLSGGHCINFKDLSAPNCHLDVYLAEIEKFQPASHTIVQPKPLQ